MGLISATLRSGIGFRSPPFISRNTNVTLFSRSLSLFGFNPSPIMTDDPTPQVREGQATITFPSAEEVFYNPGKANIDLLKHELA